MYSSIFVNTVHVLALFYQHYFMIEKIKKFLPQRAGKFISEGQILKILLGFMPLDPPPPPQTLRPLEPLLHGGWPCFRTEIFHVTPALKLNDSLVNIIASIRVKVDFHCQIIFTCINKIEVMYERPRGKVNVERGLTFIFMHDLSYVASISFTCVKFMWVHT